MTISTQKQPRPVYFTARIRLTDEQRLTLKDAYAAAREESLPSAAPTIGGSAITVSTSYGVKARLGLSDVTIRDLLSTRESISIGVILKIQELLGVQVLRREDLEEEFKSYVDYVFSDSYVKA